MTLLAMMTCALLATQSQGIDHAAQCRSEVQGMKIWVSSAVKSRRPDLYPKLNVLDFTVFCPCYHATLRRGLGKSLYERSRTLHGTSSLNNDEVMRVHDQDMNAVVSCVDAQLGGRKASRPADHYSRFIQATVTPGAVGALKLRTTRADMFRIIGPTKTFRRLPDNAEEYYYGPNSIEVIISLSRGGTVRQIVLSRHFRGTAAGGGRIGDTRETIKRTYPGRVAVDLPEFLVYCDGTTFLFRGGRLDSIRLSDIANDVWEKERRRVCVARK